MREARVGEVLATCQVCLQENVALLAIVRRVQTNTSNILKHAAFF